MITYTPPKVEILTDRAWGSTPESNIKSIIQALEVCRDNKIKPEKYESVIKKYCIDGKPPHARLLEFTNFEVDGKNVSNRWGDIDIPEYIHEMISDFHSFTCSLRSLPFWKRRNFNITHHANLPMTHDAKRIMIRLECSSKVGHHLRTHRGVSWCAQASSSLPLTEGFTICHSKFLWFERNKEIFQVMHNSYIIHNGFEIEYETPKKERIANQMLPNDWIMRPRVGVASRRQWLEMCAQRIADPGTHPETKFVCQIIQDKIEAMGEDG